MTSAIDIGRAALRLRQRRRLHRQQAERRGDCRQFPDEPPQRRLSRLIFDWIMTGYDGLINVAVRGIPLFARYPSPLRRRDGAQLV